MNLVSRDGLSHFFSSYLIIYVLDVDFILLTEEKIEFALCW